MSREFRHGYEFFLKYHAKIKKLGNGMVNIVDDYAGEREHHVSHMRDFWKNLEPYIVNEDLK